MNETVTDGDPSATVSVNGTHWRPRRRRHSHLHELWENALIVVLSINVGLVLLVLPVTAFWLLIRIADDVGRVLGSWH